MMLHLIVIRRVAGMLLHSLPLRYVLGAWLLMLAIAQTDLYSGCTADAECSIATEYDAAIKGRCENGRCICAAGYGGRNCSVGMSTIYYDHPVYKGFPAEREIDLHGWSPRKETYQMLEKRVDAQLVIEVGTWKGLSASYLGEWLKTQGRGVLICVDTWTGSLEFWARNIQVPFNLHLRHGMPTVYYSFLSNMVHLGLDTYVVPFPVPSRMAWEFFKMRNITADLVHIDGDHHYEDVKEDIALWWQIVAPGGILLGDDYMPWWPDVVRAVDEFLNKTGLALIPMDWGTHIKWAVQKPLTWSA